MLMANINIKKITQTKKLFLLLEKLEMERVQEETQS